MKNETHICPQTHYCEICWSNYCSECSKSVKIKKRGIVKIFFFCIDPACHHRDRSLALISHDDFPIDKCYPRIIRKKIMC